MAPKRKGGAEDAAGSDQQRKRSNAVLPAPLTEEQLEALVRQAEQGLDPEMYPIGPARDWAEAQEWGRGTDPVWQSRAALKEAIRRQRIGIQPPNHLLGQYHQLFRRDFEERFGLHRFLLDADQPGVAPLYPGKPTESTSVTCDTVEYVMARTNAEASRVVRRTDRTVPVPPFEACCAGKMPAFTWTLDDARYPPNRWRCKLADDLGVPTLVFIVAKEEKFYACWASRRAGQAHCVVGSRGRQHRIQSRSSRMGTRARPASPEPTTSTDISADPPISLAPVEIAENFEEVPNVAVLGSDGHDEEGYAPGVLEVLRETSRQCEFDSIDSVGDPILRLKAAGDIAFTEILNLLLDKPAEISAEPMPADERAHCEATKRALDDLLVRSEKDKSRHEAEISELKKLLGEALDEQDRLRREAAYTADAQRHHAEGLMSIERASSASDQISKFRAAIEAQRQHALATLSENRDLVKRVALQDDEISHLRLQVERARAMLVAKAIQPMIDE